MSHTPGPWRTGSPSVGRFKVITQIGGKVIGEASNYNEAAEANARLIAAAPDLLDALETVHRILQADGVFDLLTDSGECLGNVVRDAIAKAKGKA